jgi:hypothetical protein
MSANLDEKRVIPLETDPEILAKLREHDERTSVLCLECGYNGLMGIEGKVVPWYLTWWILIPICLTGRGLIPAFLLGIWRFASTKEIVRCPNCNLQLK